MSGFDYDYSKMLLANGEPATDGTKKIYRAALNRLAKGGFTNREDLLKKSLQVVAFVRDNYDTNMKKRVVLSAIFRVIQDVPTTTMAKRRYYNFFQKCKDPMPE
jgi:hypothetical protein